MRISAAIVLTAGLVALATRSVSAQANDSMPFHRGQWAANFTIGSGFAGAGVLHFKSATRALLLDIAGFYSHDNNSNGATSYIPNAGNITLRFGSRSYRALTGRVYRWTSIGVFGAYTKQTTVFPLGTTQISESVNGGIFGNLGATWMVTPHLGLGALWEARLGYSHQTTAATGNPTVTDNTVSITLDHVALTGQIFF
ncbi:MAG: hypothetical protein WBC97_08285 [Gemmatimonadales bacterium]